MSLKTFHVDAKTVKNTFALVLFNLQSTGSATRYLENIYKNFLRMMILFTRCTNTRGKNTKRDPAFFIEKKFKAPKILNWGKSTF